MNEDERFKRRRMLTRPVFTNIAQAVLTGIFMLSLLLNLVLIVAIAVMGAAVSGRVRDGVSAGYRKVYTEIGAVHKGGEADEIAVISINGIITEYDTRGGMFGYIENPMSAVRNRLSLIRADGNIKGVLLVIDSPGGGVTASDVLYTTIKRFREETGIPVFSLMKQVAASGGYYVASATEYIVAYPTAITGSIGVIVYSFNFSELMERYGVRYVAVKTDEHKDAISPFKPVDEEELAWMQGIVDRMHERFIDAVSEGRSNLTRSQVREMADGRILIASEALEKGLIDEIGYFEDAVHSLAKKAGIVSPSIVEFQKERSLRDIIGKAALTLSESFFNERIFGDRGVHPYQIFYLWDSAVSVR